MGIVPKLSVVPIIAIGIYFLKQYSNGPMCPSSARIDGKVVIVTGANTGIGKGTVRDLVSRGGKVYMACRSMERGEAAAAEVLKQTGAAPDRVQVIRLDLGSMAAIRNFVTDFKTKEKKLHILVNNAGMAYSPFGVTKDGFEQTFGVNHLGPFLLTNLLLDMMKESAPSRVVNLASMAHLRSTELDLDNINEEEHYNRYNQYSYSKLANVLFNLELSKRLQGTGVTSYAVHPGVIITDLPRHMTFGSKLLADLMYIVTWPVCKDMEYGHQTTVCCAVSKQFEKQSGLYYRDCAVSEPSTIAQDTELAKELWDYSAKQVKLTES